MDHPQRYVKPHIKSKKLISIDQVLHYFHVNGICRDGHANTRRNKKEKFLFNTQQLTDRTIRKCFYLSKMTVVDEKRNGDLEYSHLEFVEYLEFIGRLAHHYFEGTSQHLEWYLDQKIEVMLGYLFNGR